MQLTQENLDKESFAAQERITRKRWLRRHLISLGAGPLSPLVRDMTEDQLSAMEMLVSSSDTLASLIISL